MDDGGGAIEDDQRIGNGGREIFAGKPLQPARLDRRRILGGLARDTGRQHRRGKQQRQRSQQTT